MRVADRHIPVPLTVWAVSQTHPRFQRLNRYVPESLAHPARMLPALARHIIDAFTEPGDLIVDPMCGIGTTLVEAAHLGRNALGIEYESRWAVIGRANATLALTQGATGTIRLLTGDSRQLPDLAPEAARGKAALVLTSPPYGKATHGTVEADRENGVRKRDYTYSTGRGNLANTDLTDLLAGFTEILTGAAALLRPGGIVAVAVRPYRQDGELVDLPGAILHSAQQVGLVRVARAAALLAGLRQGRLVSRTTFFALHNARTAHAAGTPLHVTAHEDILLFTTRPIPDQQT
ncbi:RNA methyltransferase [Frankia sp. R43]|uniref:TRM11 family SAM-dependent methyltransferase n=1 Tax=Frankiaceae TaxID=74712 RepID=UPI0006CA5AFF|nr:MULTISPECIES: DNA methyltransferase [Frankiaceae]KPM53263.1 RNA methyltransferase [Frankia sp. R43]MBE3204688.1 site-specific DNA-methyltransferase [Parafrankia sp. CH37]